ncbi:hypothetical protein GALMADRAFT_272571 [Galerina marginata CBS 339.88]|uniref:Orotate phosphoribosyltransferase n=1 Tax=Galerina marginata (strain CBS 339.88) TaxID=685588 RepID=A0A067SBP8_GALM3|nr:hypothetical protein GALMADRAFT_272571 [Galerina marginata CBS 339.88]
MPLTFWSFRLTIACLRIAPYTFNAGLLRTGSILSTVSTTCAATIAQALKSNDLPEFDVPFAPAYKGISFAAITGVSLHEQHKIPVGFAYNRKVVKDHGEGGKMVGVPVMGKRIVVVDDVSTFGKIARIGIEAVR